ncbi:stress response protein [Grosmannia clavigera kw1407]|uniref:Stress response protein n=1 Tax=Grosmannia clavigera (strain kw1407 / UAMH 11150) TaxID=655863 RepID=F0XKH3_GROCL|nr:stress response protein [Grosmannia clavigera kw1407]EFX01588.1 stress response protein [Grosmannia clavigera kw1407]
MADDARDPLIEAAVERPDKEGNKPALRPTSSSTSKIFLACHTAGCISLAIALVFAVDGYNASDSSTPRSASGKFRFRVSDVTTLISAGLVIVKFFTTAWAAIAVWMCAYEVVHRTDPHLKSKQLSFMTRYKLPPWLRPPCKLPKGLRNWVVVFVLLSVFPQPFTSPLLSGAVDWNASSIRGTASVPVNSSDPAATDEYWYQYGIVMTERMSILRIAAGYAGLAWSDTSAVHENGTSSTGNGCRHVVNDDGLPVNSTLANSTVPCIQIQDISWATSEDQIPSLVAEYALSSSESLSLVNDTLFWYRSPGHATLYNTSNLWVSAYGLPDATLVSGALSLGLVIGHNYSGCENLAPNSFGDIGRLPQYKYHWAIGICLVFANVTLSAGVTTSAESRYISSRVVEDQTPIEDVVLRESVWTQNALWLLPDLMTLVSTMNSTSLSTWDNLDLYAENLIRQSYLAAWDSFQHTYDTDWAVSYATPREATIKATVSKIRAFSWLAISLLQTVGVTPSVVLYTAITEHGPYTGPSPLTTGAVSTVVLASSVPAAPPAADAYEYPADGKLHSNEPVPFTPSGGVGTNGSAPVYRVQSDFDYQSLALTLYQEWIELDLFHWGLAQFSVEDFEAYGLNAEDRFLLQHMADQEVGHATVVANLLGAQAPRPCAYSYPVSNVPEYVDFSQKLTRWGEAGVYGFLPHLNSGPAAQLLLQSITVEARQQMILRQFGGQFPMPEWHTVGIPQSWAWSLLAPYIASCPAGQTRLVWQNFPALHILNQPNAARINGTDVWNETTGGWANTLSTANVSAHELCVNATGTGFNCHPAITHNRSIPLSYAGRQVFLQWDAAGQKVGPNNSYVTSTNVKQPRFAAWTSQLNVTYTPLVNVSLADRTAYTFQPNASTWAGDPQVNGTMFIVLTDLDLHVTPYNLTALNPHVAAIAVYQAG